MENEKKTGMDSDNEGEPVLVYKRERIKPAGKRFLVFLAVFFLITGISSIDKVCSRSYGTERLLCLSLERQGEDIINCTFMGRSFEIDKSEIKKQIDKIEENAASVYSRLQ